MHHPSARKSSGLGRAAICSLPMQLATTPLKLSAATGRMRARRLEMARSESGFR